jgi:multiple antibiotic resistance protein
MIVNRPGGTGLRSAQQIFLCWSRPIPIFLEAIVLTLGSLLPIMNPFSTAPLFISLTAGFDRRLVRQQALMACIYAFGILASFLLMGSAIVTFFGISVPGIRVAGGLIISTIGFNMLFPKPYPPPLHAGGEAAARVQPQPQELDIAFAPIAMPSLAGPGSISVVLTAAAQIRSNFPEDWTVVYAGVIVGMALTLAFSYFVLRMASGMVLLLGKTGLDAMTRIFGFLLICIGMQFLLTGISDFFFLRHA